MPKTECIIEGCEKTFSSKRGVDSHFAFTDTPPHPQAKIKEMKKKIEAKSIDSAPKAPYQQADSESSKNRFQKNGDDIMVRCGKCNEPTILQRNPGTNYVLCDNCGKHPVPGSGR